MTRYLLATTATLLAVTGASHASAAVPTIDECRAVADPSARLACYDRITGQTANTPAPPAASAPAMPAAPAPSAEPTFNDRRPYAPIPAAAQPTSDASQAGAERRGAFESRLASVTPLPHGYYRLVLEDGTAYFTTAVAPPPPVGAEVRIRRTVIGTTYLDTAGRDPIAIRLSRRR